MNFKDLSYVTQLKILLLEHGVTFNDLNMFNRIDDIEEYKTKNADIKLRLDNFQVFDISKQIYKIPAEVLISDNRCSSLTKLRYNPNSPIQILGINDKNLHLLLNGQELNELNVSLVKENKLLQQEIPNSSKNRKIKDFVDIVGLNRVAALPYDGCYNWNNGQNCKFCDLHPRREDEDLAIPSINALNKYGMNVEYWWNSQKGEFLKSLGYSLETVFNKSEQEKMYLYFMAGNCQTNTQTWDIIEETISSLQPKIDISKQNNYLNIAPHDNVERLKRAKNLGIKQVQYNLEVVGADRFKDTCPGKMPYEVFEKKLFEAVDTFGHGNVRSNFVFGLTPDDELLSYAEYCAQNGVVMDYSIFQPKKNTQYVDKPAPSFARVCDFSYELAKIYKRHDLKPIFDRHSSRSSIINEIYDEVK